MRRSVTRSPLSGVLPKQRGGVALPFLNRLFYTSTPNSEAYPWTEGADWTEADPWGWYALPLSAHAIVGTGFWFADADTPTVKPMVDILADAGTNIAAGVIFAGTRKGVVLYSEAPSTQTYSKLAKFFDFTPA